MPVKLTTIWFAAMVAIASSPVPAAEMPTSGTKNFIPGGDAPSYFTNENGAITGAAAVDETASDDGVDRAIGSPRFEMGPVHSAKTTTRWHVRLAAAHRGEPRAAPNIGARGRSVHTASAKGTRIAAPARAIRTAGMTASPPKTKSARAEVVRPAKSSTRHAAAKSAARKG